MIALWFALALLAGLVTGAVLTYVLGHRYPGLLWPEDWLAATRLGRQRRKMTDPGDRTGS